MRCDSNIIDCSEDEERAKAERLMALRKTVDALQAIPGAVLPKHASTNAAPSLAPGLPGPGLLGGVLNEVVAAYADRPAGFGFLFASMAAALRTRAGPAAFVATRRALDFGVPYGHGLRHLGLDVGRLILIEAETDKDALWALEETLRSQARPAVVAGVVQSDLGLTQSRRLNLAAAIHATPVMVMRGDAKAMGASAAATRWRLAAAPATLDRFGTFERWRWHATLERCRNGRTGAWLLEWNPEAHRFQSIEDLPNTKAGPRTRSTRRQMLPRH
jgi:protein ImuA